MKKVGFIKVLSLILIIVLCASCLCSCMSSGVLGGTLTEEEIAAIVDQRLAALGDGSPSAGDTNIININNAVSSSLAAVGKSLLSAIRIEADFRVTSYSNWRPQTVTKTLNGSGVIYTLDKERGDAYVITNYHVVHYESSLGAGGISEDITLYLYGQEAEGYEIPATYVGGSQNYDIAVLKVTNSSVLRASSAVAAEFADSNLVSVLDTAVAIGNAESMGISATVGYVNIDSEYISMNNDDGSTSTLRVMRIDTAVNSGNSGGGLFNDKGQVIGIVNAKMSSSLVENISYAIPSNIAKNVADNIIYYCDSENKIEGFRGVYRCMLGITVGASRYYTEYDTESCKVHKREAVVVEEVQAGGLAEGNLKVGDVIKSVAVNGKTFEITRMYQVIDCMLNARVGHAVTFNIERDGTDMAIELEITQDTLTQW